MKEIENIINIQKYLLAGFIKDGFIDEYSEILTPEMFGRYKMIYIYLEKNGNVITPNFSKNINGEIYIEIMEAYSSDFIINRNKYVKELYKFIIKEKILYDKLPIEEYNLIKETYDKIDNLDKSLIFNHINYEKALEKGYEELVNTNPKKVMSWGWEEFDNKVGYLMGGQLILIGGTTGTGKSTFINQICYNVSRQGFKVARYSLEDRLEEKRKEEIYYQIGRIRKEKGLKNYPWNEFEINSIKTQEFNLEISEAIERLVKQNINIIDLEKKKQLKITDLEKLIETEAKKGCKLFAIDHLHYFDMGSDSERHDLVIQSVMHKINEIARNYSITIILVAHYKKLGKNKPTNEDFKDGVSISQVANKIIHIYRDFDEFETKTQFYISKNRSPIGIGVIEGEFDIGTYEYKFKKSAMQKERELF